MNFASLDLNLIRVLDALLRERSTVRAGARLGLSQPAVSAALGRLRHALGDPILVRQGQGMVPTAYAESLTQPLRQALDRMEEVLRGQTGFDPAQASFDFRISASDYFAVTLMPALVRQVAGAAPGIRLQLVDLTPDGYVEPLERGAVDLALMPQDDYPGWVESTPLFVATFVAIARTGHPATVDIAPGDCLPLDLFCALDHVLCSPQGRWQGLTDAALARLGMERRVRVSVPFFQAVLSIVAATDLIALVPEPLARRSVALGDLVAYRPPLPLAPPELQMIWHRRLSGDRAHDWMRAQVVAILKAAG